MILVSAFGGVVAFNKTVNEQTANEILKIFTEVIVAPEFSSKSLKLLSQKNLILVQYKNKDQPNKLLIKSTKNFLLIQDRDLKKIEKKN